MADAFTFTLTPKEGDTYTVSIFAVESELPTAGSLSSFRINFDYDPTQIEVDDTSSAYNSGFTIAVPGLHDTDAGTWLLGGTALSPITSFDAPLVEFEVTVAAGVTSLTLGHSGTAGVIGTQSIDPFSSEVSLINNTVPTGSVLITGTAAEDQTLTASNTLADEDGLGDISYQWSADGVAITDATSETLTITQSEVGKKITVTASYTDQQGTEESATSAETDTVTNVNDDPAGSVLITGTAAEDQTLTATNDLADEDGLGDISYQWSADGVAITGATSETLTLTQSEVGKKITVTASYTDQQGTEESATSAEMDTVANVNDDPTWSVTISGSATLSSTLSVVSTLDDEDGLGTLSYQWYAGENAISGANGT